MQPRSLSEVIGSNVRTRRLQAGANLQDMSHGMRSYGFGWSSGAAADFEHGRVARLNLAVVLAVAATLSDLTGDPVSLAELFIGDGEVALNETVTVPLEGLRAALTGVPVTLPSPIGLGDDEVVAEVMRAWREGDDRLCKTLGVPGAIGVTAMAMAWGTSFVTERDRRAGPDANAQRRGQVARILKAELQKVITDGHD